MTVLSARNSWIALSAIGLAASIAAWIATPTQFYRSWLFALQFWIEIPLGALSILFLVRLTGGRWGEPLQPVFRRLALSLPIFALAFVPLVFGYTSIWPRSESTHAATYLRPSFLFARAAVYFGIWILLSWAERPARFRWAGFALVLFCLSTAFAAIDWTMTLEPDWYTTMIGLIFWCREALAAFAAAILLSRGVSDTAVALRDRGNILLTLTMTWAYLSFMQYLIVWAGNLPHEASWYVHRSHSGWPWIIGVVAALQFAIPFVCFLFRSFKENPERLCAIAWMITLARLGEVYWFIAPSFMPHSAIFRWQDVAALLALGGALLVFTPRRAAVHE